MGRKKIRIARITDERNRSVTYLKRKAGLMKKAHELAVLTDSEVAVIVFGKNGKLAEFCSTDIDQLLLRYTQHDGAVESKGPSFYFAQAANAADSDDEGEEEDAESVKPASPGPSNEPAKEEAAAPAKRGGKRKASDGGSVSGRAAQKRLSTGAGPKEEEGSRANGAVAATAQAEAAGKGKIKVSLAQRRQSKEGAAGTRNGAQQAQQQQQLPPPQQPQPQQHSQQPQQQQQHQQQQVNVQGSNGMPRPFSLDSLSNSVARSSADMLGTLGSPSNAMRSSPRFADGPVPSLNLQPLEPGARHHAWGTPNQGYNTYSGPGPLTTFPPPPQQQQQHGAWGMPGNPHGGRQLSLNASLEARAMGGYGELAGGRTSGGSASDAYFALDGNAPQAHYGGLAHTHSGRLPSPAYKDASAHYSAYACDHASALAQQRHSLPLQPSPGLSYAASPTHGSAPGSAHSSASAGMAQGMGMHNAAAFQGLHGLMGSIGVPPEEQSAQQHQTDGVAQAQSGLFQQQQQQHRPPS